MSLSSAWVSQPTRTSAARCASAATPPPRSWTHSAAPTTTTTCTATTDVTSAAGQLGVSKIHGLHSKDRMGTACDNCSEMDTGGEQLNEVPFVPRQPFPLPACLQLASTTSRICAKSKGDLNSYSARQLFTATFPCGHSYLYSYSGVFTSSIAMNTVNAACITIVLRGTIIIRTCDQHKTIIFPYFYKPYLVLINMYPGKQGICDISNYVGLGNI